jgi:hypothetical protein
VRGRVVVGHDRANAFSYNSASLHDDGTVGLVTPLDRATAHFERALHETLAPSCTRLNDLGCPISRGYRTRDGSYHQARDASERYAAPGVNLAGMTLSMHHWNALVLLK